jgi:hypothetical protein
MLSQACYSSSDSSVTTQQPQSHWLVLPLAQGWQQ